MNLPSVHSLITKLLILTFFQNIFVICSLRRAKRLTHIPVPGGTRYNDTVSHGQPAKLGQFPWMVMVHHFMPTKKWECGGTVISSRWVLTAGHCVVDYPRSFLTVFGDVDKENIHGVNYNGPGIAMLTGEAVLHPNYQPRSNSYFIINDIGLLKMPQDIPFRDTIQPIRLADPRYLRESFVKCTGTITGWGQTGPDHRESRFLLWGKIPIISNRKCSKYWSRLDVNQMCTEPKTGNDLCKGDSGGPLVLRIRHDGTYLQIGITSYGDPDCPSLKPGVFTRVSSYYKWIQTYVTDLK